MKGKREPFNPSPDQVAWIKKNYGRMTRAAVCRKLGCGVNEFDKWCRKHNVRSEFTPESKTKDLTGYIRVPVPGIGNPVILVPPHRDPEEAKRKYIEKLNRKK